MKYQNPIIRGFHPDPSICRVGSDYYLATSTFEYFPGIALFHSRDLVKWKQIGNCITRPGQLDYAKFKDSGGVWAPTIRYNKGRFYVTVAIDGMGNMIMHTDDINGEWSAPVWTDFGGIDPSICFDEDEAYYCTNDFTNGHEAIVLAKIDPDTGVRKEERREIWNGTGGGWLESPHVYHIGDYYYILAAEGGMLLYLLSSNFYYRICKRKQKGKTQLAVIRKLDDVEVTDYVKELESTESPITIYINASAVGYHITWKTEDKVLEDAGTYSLRFLCTEIENRCFTGTIIGIYAADHTIIQRKTSEQDKKQETLKTQRRSSSMTITNFEASVCQTPLDYAKALCKTMMRKFQAEAYAKMKSILITFLSVNGSRRNDQQ